MYTAKYPIMRQAFYQELTDDKNPANEGMQCNITFTPVAIEYSFPLSDARVVRKLMSLSEPMIFQIIKTDEDNVAVHIDKRDDILAEHPELKYYEQMKRGYMVALSDRKYSIEKRFLLINFLSKQAQDLYEKGKGEEIPGLIQSFVQFPDGRDDVIQFFGGKNTSGNSVQPNFMFSVMDAFSMMKCLPSTPEFDKVKNFCFKRLGFEDVNENNFNEFEARVKDYLEMKQFFFGDYLKQGKNDSREYMLENIMLNYAWTYTMPFADYNLDLWDNFMFFNDIFNTIKVMLTLFVTEENSDDKFVEAITAFDKSLRMLKGSPAKPFVKGFKVRGYDTNGDMAALSLS